MLLSHLTLSLPPLSDGALLGSLHLQPGGGSPGAGGGASGQPRTALSPGRSRESLNHPQHSEVTAPYGFVIHEREVTRAARPDPPDCRCPLDEILEAAYDWSLSTDDDLRSMVLQVIDCLDSRSTSVPQSWSPPSPASSPQSPRSSPASATTGPSSSPSLPDSSSSPPPQLCQVNRKPPEVTHQPVCDGGLDGRHVRGPGGVGVDTCLRPGPGVGGAGLQLPHPPFLGNHRQAGGGGLCREVLSQDSSVINILSEKEGCINQTRTQDVKSEVALSLEVPEAQPPPPTLRGTSSLSNLPHRRHLMPALVHTFVRRPKRVQRPCLLRTRPCTPLTIVKICKKGKTPCWTAPSPP